MAIEYRTSHAGDLDGVAHVYLEAFPDSVSHYFGDRPPALRALASVFSLPLESEPGCLAVAVSGSRVVGYCLAPARTSRLARVAGRRAGRLLWQWLTGQFRVGVRALWLLGADQWRMRRAHRRAGHDIEAHILSVAIDPDCHGQGMGQALVQRGLDYLRTQGVDRVQLEVRPGNAAARHVYEKLGFRVVGEVSDSQGPWLVMVRGLVGTDGA